MKAKALGLERVLEILGQIDETIDSLWLDYHNAGGDEEVKAYLVEVIEDALAIRHLLHSRLLLRRGGGSRGEGQ